LPIARSQRIRSSDVLAIREAVGECRELGDSAGVWRGHLAAAAARLTGGDLVLNGEIAGAWGPNRTSLGTGDWGWDNGFNPRILATALTEFGGNPWYDTAMNAAIDRAKGGGTTHVRREIIADNDWYPCLCYQVVHRPLRVEHQIYSFTRLAGSDDTCSGVLVFRAIGSPEFGERERAVVAALHATVTAELGGGLARFFDPDPAALSPRVRDVLRCVLEGDGDKQIAARLRISIFTVNQSVKTIFRHFGVQSRAERPVDQAGLGRSVRVGRSTNITALMFESDCCNDSTL
jgi:DNA-binding CsgD family transcriptional regulator